ncbi:MAG TPA: energy transducer TonB [Gemmatirosa sp.]
MTITSARHERLVDTAGRLLHLGRELGRGGEGNVYEIADAPEFVAKLYHDVADAAKAEKLDAMVRAASPALTEVAAWPTTTLHPRRSAGGADAPVVGLVMPRANGAPIHRLYSPVSRRTDFPNVDWQRLVIVAHNVAAAMAQVHAAGHVIGDVNQGNLLVAPDGRVRLIDCDSFQIRDGSRWFACEVGVGHFTPPELQGRSFAGVVRTPNHDAFGLAVLVFHLLFMGRHPFAGRYAGPGDMPLERAIAEFRFAFGRNADRVAMAPPPNTLPLADASPGVADLFERAFGPDGARDGARPTAVEWKNTLKTLADEVVTCAVAPGHRYPPGLGACPWCAIAAAGGPDFFASVLVAVHHLAGFDAVAVWGAILAVPTPDAQPAHPAVPTTPPVATQPIQRWRWLAWRGHQLVAFAAGIAFAAGSTTLGTPALAVAAGLSMLFLGLRRGSGLVQERADRTRTLETARARLRSIEARAAQDHGGASARFAAKRQALDALRAEYLGLDAARQRARQELDAKRREHQLQQYLDGHVIATSGVPGIGTGRAATLASYGIETAADVTYAAVVAVPGFGGKRANDLVVWRASIEHTFRFDPTRSVDPAAVAALETRFARRRDEIERALAAGPAALRQLGSVATRLREQVTRDLSAQQVAVGTATANVAAATGRTLPIRHRALGWGIAAALTIVSGTGVSRLLGPHHAADAGVPTADLRAYLAPPPPVSAPPALAGPAAASRPAPRGPNGSTYFEFQVEKQAATVPGTLSATYPTALRAGYFGGDGKVVAQFVVDPSGHADMRTWKVLESTNDLFSQAARDGVSRAQFYPAEIGGRKVKQLVQLPFTFTLTR